LDIEFQNYKHESWYKWQHRIGRVAIVNSIGETVLDVYAAYPREDGVEKRVPPRRFGVSFQDLKYENGTQPSHKVERWVKQIIRDRNVIVHGGKHDLTAFDHELDVITKSKIVDTQVMYSYLQFHRTPGLQTVAAAILNEYIQGSEHSPVEDAQLTMKLYLRSNEYDRGAEVTKLAAEKQ
jgi:RNA exonuclease 4